MSTQPIKNKIKLKLNKSSSSSDMKSGMSKNVNLNLPENKSVGEPSAIISPDYMYGSYKTKKGNEFFADYDKNLKSFSVGARLNMKKKK